MARQRAAAKPVAQAKAAEVTYRDAIREAIRDALRRDERVLLMAKTSATT